MTTGSHIALLANYNEWMNNKLYAAARTLPAEALAADRQAFFGSIIGTLNHILVADTIWLQRFATHPAGYSSLEPVRRLAAPPALDTVLFADIDALFSQRQMLDQTIKQWAAQLTEADLLETLRYRNVKGEAMAKRFSSLITHFFNHQTHHRGQASTLLFQAGADIGVTDLLALIPDEEA
nr:DinB family protein [uncultured Pseudomonas sp.]